MSAQDVERLRRGWEAWNRGAYEEAAGLFHPDVVYVDGFVPDSVGQTYHGPEGVMEAWARWSEPWEGITTELQEVVDRGERLVSIHRQRARAKGSGIDVDLRFAYVVTMRDGKIAHLRSYLDPDEALGAVEAPE